MKTILQTTTAMFLIVAALPSYAAKQNICELINKNDLASLKQYIAQEAPTLKSCGSSENLAFHEQQLSPLSFALLNQADDDIINLLLENGADATEISKESYNVCLAGVRSVEEKTLAKGFSSQIVVHCPFTLGLVDSPVEAALFTNRPVILKKLEEAGAKIKNSAQMSGKIKVLLSKFGSKNLQYFQSKAANPTAKDDLTDTLDLIFSRIDINERPEAVSFGGRKTGSYQPSFLTYTLFSPSGESAFQYIIAKKADLFGTFVNELLTDNNPYRFFKDKNKVEDDDHISHDEFVKRLTAVHAKENLLDKDGHTILWYSGDYWADDFIKAGVNINAQDKNGNTVIMSPKAVATDKLYPISLELALKNGINPNIQNNLGQTALMIYIQDKMDGVSQLVEVSDLSIKDKEGKTALDYAMAANDRNLIATLIEKGSDFKEKVPTLVEDLRISDPVYKVLVAKSFDASVVNSKGDTLIMQLTKSSYGKKKEDIETLVKLGSDIDKFNDADENPLLYASRNKNEKDASLLIDCGADVDVSNKVGVTPLMLASTGTGKYALVKLLLDKGADINTKDKSGRRALDYAAKNSEVYMLLVENGAKAGDPKANTASVPSSGSSSGFSSFFSILIKLGLLAGIIFYFKDKKRRESAKNFLLKTVLPKAKKTTEKIVSKHINKKK